MVDRHWVEWATDLFSAIRGAQRLTMVRNLIQTTLGLVWLFPKFFPPTLWFNYAFSRVD